MNKYIVLHSSNSDNNEIYVNLNMVTSFEKVLFEIPNNEGIKEFKHTNITLFNGKEYSVRETPQQILGMIDKKDFKYHIYDNK